MGVHLQLILTLYIVNLDKIFGLSDNQPTYQVKNPLFDLIENNIHERSELYYKNLKQRIVTKQEAFDTMKEELLIAQMQNMKKKINFVKTTNGQENIVAVKRETDKNVHLHSSSTGKLVNNYTLNESQRSPNENDPRSKYKIVMIRHGESEWNLKNLFCGWYDADLSEKGVEEAKRAGATLKKQGYQFDLAHTSVLTRAQKTLDLVLEELGQSNIPVYRTWRLNERHYGTLTGLNKAETAKKYGEDQVRIWRRSYDIPPPPMEKSHQYYENIVNDTRYRDEPTPKEFPHFESLKMTIERALPYWNEVIVPQIKEGKRILIAAHGNSLRGIVKYLDNISENDIMTLNLPTGIPFVYELDDNLKPVVSLRFLGDEETVARGMAAVAAQGKAAT